MATRYYGETDRTRGVLVYSTSQTDTSVTITAYTTLQAKSYYGSGYRVTTKINGEQVATTLSTVPDIYYSFTDAFSTSSASRTFTRKSSAYTVRVESSYAGENDPVTDSFAGGMSGSDYVDITIPALPSYIVSYNANGGSGAPSSQTKYHGTALTLSSTKPTRTGYTFKGWGTSASDTTVDYNSGATYTANSGATLYAIWQIDTYTVSYNANGGSGAPASQTKTYGVNLTLSTTVPTRTGYTFKGWATSSSGSVAYAAGATYTANSGVTLYAVWQIITYTISYDKNTTDTVTNMPSNQSKTYGVNTNLSTAIPVRSGYDFLGWSRDAASAVATWVPGELYNLNESSTFYAIWELSYQKPTFSNVEVYRCDESGNAANEGTYARIKANVTTFSSDYTLSQASIILRKDGTQVSSKTVSISGTSATINEIISGLDNGAHEIVITVTDNGGSAAYTALITPVFVIMDIGAEGKSIGIGVEAPDDNVPENGLLKIGADVELAGSFIGAGDYSITSDEQFNEVLDSIIATMPVKTRKIITTTHSSTSPLRGGVYTLTIDYQYTDYAFVTAVSYQNYGRVAVKTKYYGTWGEWKWIIDGNKVPITAGGTGATDAAIARANLGITPANIGAAGRYDLNSETISGSSWSAVISSLKTYYGARANSSVSMVDLDVNGSRFQAEVKKTSNDHGYIYIKQYGSPGVNEYQITIYDGTWSDQKLVSSNGIRMLEYGGTSSSTKAGARKNLGFDFSNIDNIWINSNPTNGWMLQFQANNSVDNHTYRIGFDKTNGVYGIDDTAGKYIWNIQPLENKMAWKKTSVSLSSGSGSFSASGVTTSSTVLCQRGDTAMSGGNYSDVAAADCNSAGTIKIGADETQSSTWVVSAWWSK